MERCFSTGREDRSFPRRGGVGLETYGRSSHNGASVYFSGCILPDWYTMLSSNQNSEERRMVAHVEFFNIDLSKKAQWLEGMRKILDYYERKFPEVIKTPMVPLTDYEDVSSSSAVNPPDQWIVLETFESEEAMKEARQKKFSDPEWKELMSDGSLIPKNFTHSFCEVIT